MSDATSAIAAKRDTPSEGGGPTPYIRRQIEITITLNTLPTTSNAPATGAFAAPGKPNTVKLVGHRASVTIAKAEVAAKTTCSIRVYGMRFSQIQAIITRGRKFAAVLNHVVEVMAGDDTAGLTRVFKGTITQAHFDGESQPDTALQIEASAGALEELRPAPPIAVSGGADVATLMENLAKQMGVTFENHGVVAKLRDVYYPGTAMQQVRRIAEHSGINATLDNGVLAIWPAGKSRDSGDTPLITSDNGMKNYPIYDSRGIMVTCLFRPLKYGAPIIVKSHLWNNDPLKFFVYGYTYSLETETQNGQWFSTFGASWDPITPLGQPAPSG